MAEYTFNLVSQNGDAIDSFTFDLWLGNRNATSLKVFAIGQTLYSYLAYQDDESHDAVWLALGDAGLDWAKAHIGNRDWKQCAVTTVYPMAGRNKLAVFTMNSALGGKLSGNESFYLSDGSDAFVQAQVSR